MTKRALAALILAMLAASPQLLAQTRRPTQPQQQQQRPAEPAPAEPEPQAPSYEPQLLKLAEIIGSLSYLRTLCETREAQDWRERMATLLESEGRSPQRRERLASAYNRGYRAYSATHRTCSDGTQEASARLAQEGEKLAKTLASRFGG
ncbi:TIGR02301 family protein [Bosea sp. NPDC055332]